MAIPTDGLPPGDGQLPAKPQAYALDLGERLARHDQRLRLLVQHLCGNALRQRIEIDDLVQEVYLRAIGAEHKLPPFEAETDLALWHFLIPLARHTVIDAARAIRSLKRSGKTARLNHSDWSSAGPRASQILSRTRGPLSRVAAQETSRLMRQRFDGLPGEYRRVLGLRQFEGLSARDAAARMGRSESAIHSLYRRALIAWQAALHEEKPN